MNFEAYCNKVIKNIFDILFSTLIVIFIFSWFFPLIAALIKLSSRGPVFFVQKRFGINNKVFKCIKFRTMYINKESDIKPALIDDSRVTPLGKHLRKYHFDEFPQFINVLVGDMSIVGPRPHMIEQSNELSNSLNQYSLRRKMKPGITGLAQLKGFSNQDSYIRLMQKRNKLDVLYIKKWSLSLDFYIIYLTILKIIRNIYYEQTNK
ncbi:MAG: sugar transferase [Flavobacteriaceae bacterium]